MVNLSLFMYLCPYVHLSISLHIDRQYGMNYIDRAMPTGLQHTVTRCRGIRRMSIKTDRASGEQAHPARSVFMLAWLKANAQKKRQFPVSLKQLVRESNP